MSIHSETADIAMAALVSAALWSIVALLRLEWTQKSSANEQEDRGASK